jgi:hypothetical protein
VLPIEDRMSFYRHEAGWLAEELELYIEDLSTQISSISNPREGAEYFEVLSFYLYFHFRKVSDKEYYLLCLAIGFLLDSNFRSRKKGTTEIFILYELFENIIRNENRWEHAKWSKGFMLLIESLNKWKGIDKLLPPIREWKGNYQVVSFRDTLKRIFTIRVSKHENIHEEKEPLKHKAHSKRIRGYTDQGSASSESTRARRQANIFGSKEEIQKEIHRKQLEIAQLNYVRFQVFYKEQRE